MEIELMLQPIVHIESGLIVAAECLTKWKHETSTHHSPPEIVNLLDPKTAFEFEMIVLQRALEIANRARKEKSHMRIFVNIFPDSLKYPKAQKKILNLLVSENNHLIQTLVLELLEIGKMNLTSWLTLDALRKHGIKIALDDIGSGNNCTQMMQKFPFNYYKTDANLLKEESEQNHLQLQAIRKLALKRKTPCICEGIETEEEVKKATDLGFIIGQGYHYHRPITPEEFLTLIQTPTS